MSKSLISTFDLMKMFPDGDTVRKYIENRRWKDGVVCSTCGNSTLKAWIRWHISPFFSETYKALY